MKDNRGYYYHPFPQNKAVRMYVREAGGDFEFRMWSRQDDQLWQEHGWVPYRAILQAQEMYTGKGFDPRQAYDIDLARCLIEEMRQDRRK